MSIASDLATKYEQFVIGLRREFHANPELGMQEKETSARIIKEIESMGLPYEIVGPYGIIATLKGGQPGKTIMLRADMDALPTKEDADNLAGPRPVVSCKEGVAHLCGHDAHVAMLLGAMKGLVELKDHLSGTVLFCFEQAEESGGGIDFMLEALSKKTVDGCWGIHVYAGLPSGTISVDPGPRMSGAGGFDVTIRGKGGHGSRPDQTIDPIQCAAQCVTNLSAILSRELSPMDSGVVTIGTFRAGEVGNVIPETAFFSGTARAFEMHVGLQIKDAFIRIVKSVAAAHRCEADINYRGPNPGVINDAAMAALAAESVKKSIGEEHLITCEPWMASESMSRYLIKYPGVFAFLGIANEK
ncbi:MAG TPA: amidohydrolase, partial [Firmicutes bacterium]|nr:amidohydrolase [Candidatus Fermentithermobacillaceae bacterium]